MVDLEAEFRGMVAQTSFPCVGAKSALSKGQLHTIVARDIRSNWDDRRIYAGLMDIVSRYRADRKLFQSFAVLFKSPNHLSERQFEHYLWKRAESLSNKDNWLGKSYDHRVSSDPEDPHFSLSFGEEAFFIVGLHPNSSRLARRFQAPALVFNLHDQFEQLRDQNRYEKMRSTILQRDEAYSGSLNPMLARHGDTSEARQYSGREVEETWQCPFHPVGRV